MSLNEVLGTFGSNVSNDIMISLRNNNAVDYERADYRLTFEKGTYFVYMGEDLVHSHKARK